MSDLSWPRKRSSLNPTGSPISPWLHIDLALILSCLTLGVTGVLMVYSATRGSDPTMYDKSFLSRHTLFVVTGTLLMLVTSSIPYRRLRDLVPIVFWGSNFLLLLVLTPLGVERNGTRAWFEFGQFQLQPSEFCKVAFIFALASYLERFDGHLNERAILNSLLLASVPLGLILLETDVGSALVFVAITMGMLLVGGAQTRHIVLMTVVGIAGIAVIWSTGLLQDYQRDRLTSFIDPASSQTEAAYQQNTVAYRDKRER